MLDYLGLQVHLILVYLVKPNMFLHLLFFRVELPYPEIIQRLISLLRLGRRRKLHHVVFESLEILCLNLDLISVILTRCFYNFILPFPTPIRVNFEINQIATIKI